MSNVRPYKSDIASLMIHRWGIIDTDFLGFYCDINNPNEMLSYHHTRVAACKGGPVDIHNGSILWRCTAHDYLHIIERYDKDLFKYLTLLLIEVNNQNYLPDHDQIVRINGGLNGFEREYCGEYTKKGNLVIKESFTRRLVK